MSRNFVTAPFSGKSALRCGRWIAATLVACGCAWWLHMSLVMAEAGYGSFQLSRYAADCLPFLLGLALLRWPDVSILVTAGPLWNEVSSGLYFLRLESPGKDEALEVLLTPLFSWWFVALGLFAAILLRLAFASAPGLDD